MYNGLERMKRDVVVAYFICYLGQENQDDSSGTTPSTTILILSENMRADNAQNP
jgi:hypothetical protein